jgi:hypothetical protein
VLSGQSRANHKGVITGTTNLRKKVRRRDWIQKTTCVPRPHRQDMRRAQEAVFVTTGSKKRAFRYVALAHAALHQR